MAIVESLVIEDRVLERQLVEPLRPEYVELLRRARERLRDE